MRIAIQEVSNTAINKIGPFLRITIISFMLLAVSAAQGAEELPPDWGSGPEITLVVPTSVGTSQDILARVLASQITGQTGRQVLVTNQAGASSAIATNYVLRAAPDGSTLLYAGQTMAIAPALIDTLTYEQTASLTPIAMISSGSLMSLAVAGGFSAQTVPEFIEAVRSNPNSVTYGSPGVSTPQNLSMTEFALREDLSLRHVPYSGSAGLVTALAAGEVDSAFIPINNILQFMEEGTIRILATVGDERSELTPEVPTFAELGMEDQYNLSWHGIFAPPNTPPEIAEALSIAVLNAVNTSEFADTQRGLGLSPQTGGPDVLAEGLRADSEHWRRVIEEGNIEVQP